MNKKSPQNIIDRQVIDRGTPVDKASDMVHSINRTADGKFLGLFLDLVEYISRGLAINLDVFTNHRFGERHVSPLLVVLHWLFVTLSVMGLFNEQIGGIGAAFGAILIVGLIVAMLGTPFLILCIHAYFARRRRKKGDYVYSYSMGIPWIYTLTKKEFFLTEKYRLLFQPLICILIGVGLLLLGRELSGNVRSPFHLPESLMAMIGVGASIIVFAIASLIRNAIIAFRSKEILLNELDIKEISSFIGDTGQGDLAEAMSNQYGGVDPSIVTSMKARPKKKG